MRVLELFCVNTPRQRRHIYPIRQLVVMELPEGNRGVARLLIVQQFNDGKWELTTPDNAVDAVRDAYRTLEAVAGFYGFVYELPEDVEDKHGNL